MKNIAIVGGGLAGLVSGIQLAKKGVPCAIFERKDYPINRVCGEYISNETLSFLKQNNLYPENFNPPQISFLQLSSVSGHSATMLLDLGGFGISRYAFDHFLYKKAVEAGVKIHTNTEVLDVVYNNTKFNIELESSTHSANLVIGTFGKRSRLDTQLRRKHLTRRSPYVGIKYHVKSNHPENVIALHNFSGGYCGVVNVENGITNICYLVHRDVVRRFKNISEMEKHVLFKNPNLEKLFKEAVFTDNKPLVINEISFATKGPVEHHMLLAGDAAGMITPLCGNGMAMAIRSGKLISEISFKFCEDKITRDKLETDYRKAWSKLFSQRLMLGRIVQKLFGNSFTSDFAVKLMLHSSSIAQLIVRNTHGKPF
ncbi:NAD(P)/FAD-dependent oxidoreductase [Chryseosolibacter indicus]|uniref:NAD(P)/FAD-dependent oxidoreductase n=1 Tax=Chryseosolibacter indicus TaxID=2782351 RepID=A0ABS5VRZ6_9BACT|nr:NAD(P)/FAD-dependent oxidoreductase [Chryseosolibacter indicus]MBT1704218.1 NAD(P)/FAD-dependent oxidoreductase [Chryseosolibacter indicus]